MNHKPKDSNASSLRRAVWEAVQIDAFLERFKVSPDVFDRNYLVSQVDDIGVARGIILKLLAQISRSRRE